MWQKAARVRSEEHTSELQSLMRTSYALCCVPREFSVLTPAFPTLRLSGRRQRNAHVLGHGLVEAEDLDRADGRRAGRAAGEQEHGCGGDAGEGRGHAGSITGARQEAINGSAIRGRIRACGRRRPGFAVETDTRTTSKPEAAL